jgi:hypothetical protein
MASVSDADCGQRNSVLTMASEQKRKSLKYGYTNVLFYMYLLRKRVINGDDIVDQKPSILSQERLPSNRNLLYVTLSRAIRPLSQTTNQLTNSMELRTTREATNYVAT